MALAYDAARVTRDVDAVFKPHGIVLEEAREVADDLGLPYWWLNEQASVYISGKEDASKRRVFDHPGLRVMAASPAHVFAMKARAARTRDFDDLRLLAGVIGVDSADTALGICHGPGKVDIRARVMAIGLVRGGVSCVVLDERFDMRARFPKIGGATHPSLRKVPCPRCYLP